MPDRLTLATVTRFLSRLEASRRAEITQGIEEIEKLTTEKISPLVEFVVKQVESEESGAEAPELNQLGEKLELTEDRAYLSAQAAAMFVPAIAEGIGTEEILEICKARGLLKQITGNYKAVMNALSENRSKLRTLIRSTELAGALLPTLQRFSSQIDIRLDFGDDEQPLSVPVVLAYIQTDIREQKLFFQMGKSELKEFKREVNEAYEKLLRAEKMTLNGNADG